MVNFKNRYISTLIEYIEQNLPNDIDTKVLGELGYVSHTQLYRDFYGTTGYPVKEYVRRRRLSNALALIKTSEFSLADIAYQCGFSSQQSMCRAVKSALGMTPLEYRNSDVYFFFPPFDAQTTHSITVTTETIPDTLCVKFYQPSLRNIENNAVNALISAVPEYADRLGMRIFGRNGKQEGTKFCYELYLSDTDSNTESILTRKFDKVLRIPKFTGMFAICDVVNDEMCINSAWNYLYSGWLSGSMFEQSEKNYFEEYIIKNGRVLKLRLHLAIRKREDYANIKLIQNPNLQFIVSKARGINSEQTASKSVISFLSAHYPYILKSSKEFYLNKGFGSHTCGVRTTAKLRIGDGENAANLFISDGFYLLLNSNVMGDYDKYSDMLLTFAENNGMTADRYGIFAVYNVSDGYEAPKIQVYCPVKMVQNDNMRFM